MSRNILSRRSLLTSIAAFAATPALAQRPPSNAQVTVRPATSVPVLSTARPMLIATGTQGGTFVRMGGDLSTLMNDAGLDLRAFGTHGSVENARRLFTQPDLDLALVATDAATYVRGQLNQKGASRLQYIAKLGTNDLHIVARDPAIQKIGDLEGKRVVVDMEDSGTAVTSLAVFHASGVEMTPVYVTPRRGLEMLKHGEVDAVTYAIGKPGDLFASQAAGSVHFVAAPMVEALIADYLPQSFTAADYPNLIAEGQAIETISVGVALACFGWTTAPNEKARYDLLERFTKLFVQGFGDLQQPPYHPQWQNVSLSATLPGWTRFAPVEKVLDAVRMADAAAAERESAFGSFLAIIGQTDAPADEKEKLRGVFNGLRAQAKQNARP